MKLVAINHGIPSEGDSYEYWEIPDDMDFLAENRIFAEWLKDKTPAHPKAITFETWLIRKGCKKLDAPPFLVVEDYEINDGYSYDPNWEVRPLTYQEKLMAEVVKNFETSPWEGLIRNMGNSK